MISMAGPRMLLLTGVNLLIIFHLCQAQTTPDITTNMVTNAVTIATTGPATSLIIGTTGATSRATTDAATTGATSLITSTTGAATSGATSLITGTTGAATTSATSRATTDAATTGATSRVTTDSATTMDRTAASAITTKNPQTTKEASTKSMSITDTAATSTDVVTSKVTTQTAQEANTDSNDTATTTDAGLYSTDGIFPTENSTGDFSTNSTTTTDGGSTLEQHEVAIIAASIILVFLLCTGCCLFLLSDWSCTQPKQAKGEPGCCSCSCFSRQDFGNTSGFTPGKSESRESLEMEMTHVTEVGSFTNTSTLHWSTANHHSFHKTEDPENRGNNFRGVIAMISDDGDASRSKKYSEAINLDIFHQGEEDTGGDSLAGDEVSDTSNHTLVTVVSVHTQEHNERSSQRSSNSDPAAGGGHQYVAGATGSHQDELAPEQTVPKKSQGRKRGVFMSDSDVSEGGKNRSYSQSVAEAMRTFDSTALAHYNEEEEHKDSMMTTEL